MADPRFFQLVGPFSLGQLAEISGAEIASAADPETAFTDVAPLETAERHHVSFFDNRKYLGAFKETGAGACLVTAEYAEMAPAGTVALISPDPYRAYAKVAQAFYPAIQAAPGIDPRAHVDPSADVDPTACIDAGAVVGPGAEVGRRCHVGPNTTVGTGVVLGEGTRIGPNVTLAYCVIGRRVIIHAGARIGQDGFGFAMGPGGHLKVPQLGRVIIDDDVEIGANTTIDRGSGPDTVIGAGTKIDNLVQVGHNVRIGKGCVIVAEVGISGSTRIGDFVVIAGQVGLAGHLNVGSGAQIAAQSGISRDIPPGAKIAGTPGMPVREHWRQLATLSALTKKGKERGTDS